MVDPEGRVRRGRGAAGLRACASSRRSSARRRPRRSWSRSAPCARRTARTCSPGRPRGTSTWRRSRSNTFTMEWPPQSGKQAEFPEIDRAEWFPVDVAREKLNPAQAEFLDRSPPADPILRASTVVSAARRSERIGGVARADRLPRLAIARRRHGRGPVRAARGGRAAACSTCVSLVIGVATPACVGLVLLSAGRARSSPGSCCRRVLGRRRDGGVPHRAVALDRRSGLGARRMGADRLLRVARALRLAARARLRYPDGRLPSPRWRPAAWLARSPRVGGAMLLLPFGDPLEGPYGDVPNPLPDIELRSTPVFWVCWFGVLISLVGGALALRARYARRTAARCCGSPTARCCCRCGSAARRCSARVFGVEITAPTCSVLMLVHTWLAVAVAVAVTRHGLYAIDRLFSRTLVYGLLTALLAGTYVRRLAAGRPARRLRAHRRGRHAGRRAGLPAAARPPAGRRRPPLRPRPLRGRAAACGRSSTTCATGGPSRRTSARRCGSRSTTRPPRCSSGCPRPAPSPTAAAISSPLPVG